MQHEDSYRRSLALPPGLDQLLIEHRITLAQLLLKRQYRLLVRLQIGRAARLMMSPILTQGKILHGEEHSKKAS